MAASARGLFRATGKRRKARPVRDLVTGEYYKTDEPPEREKDEFYPTPIEPIRAFLGAEIQWLREYDPVWENAAGDGVMVREMLGFGLNVYASDLIDRGCEAEIRDFYSYTKSTRPARAAMSNPPFAECNWRDGQARWLYHALETLELDYLACLLPLSWPGPDNLRTFLDRHTPSRSYLVCWKIDFTGEGSPPTYHEWYVWQKGSAPDWRRYRLYRGDDARQSSLL
jgi:hypothetical protein